jgi:hypothetical protein
VRLSEIAAIGYQVFDKKGSIRFLKDKPRIENFSDSSRDDLYEKIKFWPPTSLTAGIEKIKQKREMT